MKVEAIVPAGGSGARFGGKTPKVFTEISGKPLIVYCLDVFERSSPVSSVIVAVEAGSLRYLQAAVQEYGLRKVKKIVPGGATRRASIENALRVLDADTDLVMIHDAARPVLTVDMVEAAAADCRVSGANVTAVDVVPTIKRVDVKTGLVQETLDRSLLREIQTPQTFRKDILLDAYARRGDFEPTDDASLVERAGYPVKVIPGSRRNIKVTTPEDLALAEILFKNSP